MNSKGCKNTFEIRIEVASNQQQFFQLSKVRSLVFVKEQLVEPDIEIDDEDQTAIHFIAYCDNIPSGTCRIVKHDNYYKVGRLAVSKEYRRCGVASKLLCKVEEYVKNTSIENLVLHAQVNAIPLYESLGYTEEGSRFYEANIEHVVMRKKAIK